MDFDAQIRILLLGESGAGKTSLLLRFTDDMFERSTVSTVGVDFRVKKLTLQWRRVRLQIWCVAHYLHSVFVLSCRRCHQPRSRDALLLSDTHGSAQGYQWPRTLPIDHPLILPRRAG
jgi:ABC-type molybdenum transport system ATPase subunit/photorepair protein PhrA